MSWIKTWELIEDDKRYLIANFFPKNGRTAFCFAGSDSGKMAKDILKSGHYVALEITLPKSLEECR